MTTETQCSSQKKEIVRIRERYQERRCNFGRSFLVMEETNGCKRQMRTKSVDIRKFGNDTDMMQAAGNHKKCGLHEAAQFASKADRYWVRNF